MIDACGLAHVYSAAVRLQASAPSSVGGHGVADPAVVDADLGVDAGLVLLGAAYPPGHHALQLTVAHHGATRVHLGGGHSLLRGLLHLGEDKFTLPLPF